MKTVPFIVQSVRRGSGTSRGYVSTQSESERAEPAGAVSIAMCEDLPFETARGTKCRGLVGGVVSLRRLRALA